MSATEARRDGDWMQTFTGRAFWPLDPRPDEIDLMDIAHALSHLCRYGGHSQYFYSVAEHSVLLSTAVPAEHAAWALLHDASEAYLADVIRPIKPHLRGYAQIEETLLFMVSLRFDLPWPVPDVVKACDTRMLLNEQAALMPNPPHPWCVPGEPLDLPHPIVGWPPEKAKALFLHRAAELGVY